MFFQYIFWLLTIFYSRQKPCGHCLLWSSTKSSLCSCLMMCLDDSVMAHRLWPNGMSSIIVRNA